MHEPETDTVHQPQNDHSGSTPADGKIGRLKKWAFSPHRDNSKPMGIIRSWFRIFFIMLYEFSETNINVRAAALTYSIVLSMVPILAMSTAVLKGLGSDNQLKVVAYHFIDQIDPGTSPVHVTGTDSVQPEGSPSVDKEPSQSQPGNTAGNELAEENGKVTAKEKSLTSHLRNAVDTVFRYVEQTNFAALGAFGILGLLLAVLFVLSTIEKAMNEIWHTTQGRSIFRKIMDYQALLILLPISINIALAGDAMLESPRMMSYLHTIIPSPWLIKMLLKLLPFLFIILTLMLMFQFFPNVRVKPHAAFAGALFAGFFWFVVQRIYIVLQIGVAKYNAIYGSFATVPLFLIWIHLGWTFILLGATLAYAVQNRHRYHLPGMVSTPQRKLQLAFDVLNTIHFNFIQKKATTLDELNEMHSEEDPGNIMEITDLLVEGGLLHRMDNDNLNYVPASPADKVEAKEVVRLILGNEKLSSLGGLLSGKIIRAAEKAIPADTFPVTESALPLPAFLEHVDEEHKKTS